MAQVDVDDGGVALCRVARLTRVALLFVCLRLDLFRAAIAVQGRVHRLCPSIGRGQLLRTTRGQSGFLGDQRRAASRICTTRERPAMKMPRSTSTSISMFPSLSISLWISKPISMSTSYTTGFDLFLSLHMHSRGCARVAVEPDPQGHPVVVGVRHRRRSLAAARAAHRRHRGADGARPRDGVVAGRGARARPLSLSFCR